METWGKEDQDVTHKDSMGEIAPGLMKGTFQRVGKFNFHTLYRYGAGKEGHRHIVKESFPSALIDQYAIFVVQQTKMICS